MFFKLRPFLFSLIFLIGLEVIISDHSLVFWVAGFLLFFSVYQGLKLGREWYFAVLPAFFTLSTVALLYLVTMLFEQQVFILLAAFMYYLSLFSAYRLGKYPQDQTAKGMNMAATTATLFFTYAGAYGIYLNFLVPLYILMLIYAGVTLLVSYQQFIIAKENEPRTIWIYSLLLALVMAEIAWVVNYWPFGYLTPGVIALILYYVLWEMAQSYFLGILSQKRVVANMVFFTILIIMVLLSSKWIPAF